MENQQFCQSCGMPLQNPEDFGTERDGSKSEDYCKHCYVKGEFPQDITMEQMIDFCVPYTVEQGVYPTAEAARGALMEYFPKLKRWATA